MKEKRGAKLLNVETKVSLPTHVGGRHRSWASSDRFGWFGQIWACLSVNSMTWQFSINLGHAGRRQQTEEGARWNHVGPLLSLLVPSSLRPEWTLTDWFDHQSVQTSCIFQPDLKETGSKFQSLKIWERWKIECLRKWEIRQFFPIQNEK